MTEIMSFGATSTSSSTPTDWWATNMPILLTLLLVIVGAVSAYIAMVQVRELRRTAFSEAIRNRGDLTMAAVNDFKKIHAKQQSTLLRVARRTRPISRVVRKKHTKVADLLASPKLKDPVKEALQEQLNALEMLSIGAETQIFDVKIIHAAACGIVVQLWNRSEQYRDRLANGTLDSRPPQPSVFEHSAWLVDKFKILELSKPKESRLKLDETMPGG